MIPWHALRHNCPTQQVICKYPKYVYSPIIPQGGYQFLCWRTIRPVICNELICRIRLLNCLRTQACKAAGSVLPATSYCSYNAFFGQAASKRPGGLNSRKMHSSRWPSENRLLTSFPEGKTPRVRGTASSSPLPKLLGRLRWETNACSCFKNFSRGFKQDRCTWFVRPKLQVSHHGRKTL